MMRYTLWILSFLLLINFQTTPTSGSRYHRVDFHWPKLPSLKRTTPKPLTTTTNIKTTIQNLLRVYLRCYSSSSLIKYLQVPLKLSSRLVNTVYLKPKKQLNILIHGIFAGYDKTMKNVIENLMKKYESSQNYCALIWNLRNVTYTSNSHNTTRDIDLKKVMGPDYIDAYYRARDVGIELGNVLLQMEHKGVKMDKVYLIGYGEGANIAGVAGKQVSVNGKLVERITALDAIKPTQGHGLNNTCAKYVDSVNTNSVLFGNNMPYGGVDFWINYGCLVQPGCEQDSAPARSYLCSHERAVLLFIESLQSPESLQGRKAVSFWAWRHSNDTTDDNDINYIGPNISSSNNGSFYLCTSNKPPYGKGEKGLKIKSCHCD